MVDKDVFYTTMKKIVLLTFVVLTLSCEPATRYAIVIRQDSITGMPFIGHGVQWAAYHHGDCETAEWGHLMTDAKWQMNFDRLDFMKPGIIRVLDQANWRYLKGFNSKGDAILDFESPEMQALYKLLGYCESRDITVMLGEWGSPYKVHDLWNVPEHFNITGVNDPAWIDIIVKHLDYLINTKNFTCIKYYNLVNEPNGSWASTDGNWDEWSMGVRMLHNKIKEAGLDKQISIAGPDAVPGKHNSDFGGAEWLKKSIDEMDELFGCYDVHSYPQKEYIFSGDFARYYAPLASKVKATGKPIVFGELGSNRSSQLNQDRIKEDPNASEDSQMEVYDFSYGIQMADACIQAMNLGFGGIMVWNLDDAMHTLDDAGDRTQLKKWGMWNSLGKELCNKSEDENIRPWFFPWSLLCRYFLSGSTIIPIDSGNDMIHIVAGQKDSDYTIAISNIGEEDFSFVLKAEQGLKVKDVKKYIYDEENCLRDEKGFPLPSEQGMILNLKKGEFIKIKAQTILLLTTIDHEV